MEIEELIGHIMEKKELAELDRKIVEELANSTIKKNKLNLNELRKKELKTLIKLIRADLRKYVGRFQVNKKKKDLYIEKKDFKSLLSIHSSTKERLDFYPELNKIIDSLNINSILDLGCGLNPLAMARKGTKYYASDIMQGDLSIVLEYFKSEKIDGEVFFYDLRKIDDFLPKGDITLMLKVIDVIETKGHKLAEKILLSLKSKYILVSFSTKTLSGKPMNHPQRGWIERLLNRIGYKFSTFNSRNEIFYLIQPLT